MPPNASDAIARSTISNACWRKPAPPGDLDVRKQWDDYMEAYEAALSATSTRHAPWHVIPANNKLTRKLMISELLIDALEGLKMRYPDPLEGVADTRID